MLLNVKLSIIVFCKRDDLPKIYSQELLNNLFKHPYTKIDFVMEDVRGVLQLHQKSSKIYLNVTNDLPAS